MPNTINLTTISSDIKTSIGKGTLHSDAETIKKKILKGIQEKFKEDGFKSKVDQQLIAINSESLSLSEILKLEKSIADLESKISAQPQEEAAGVQPQDDPQQLGPLKDKLKQKLGDLSLQNSQVLQAQLEKLSTKRKQWETLKELSAKKNDEEINDSQVIEASKVIKENKNIFKDDKSNIAQYVENSLELYDFLAKNNSDAHTVLDKIKLFDDTKSSPYLSYEEKQDENKVALDKYLEFLGDKCPETSSKSARIEFLKFLNKLPVDITVTEKTMEQLLGKQGVELYKNALKEEIKSREFQTEYFQKSLKTYKGKRPKENWDILVLSGVSGAGKTSTGHYEISKMYPKDEENAVENSEFNLVWIDGGIPREISRMQMVIKRFIEAHGCNVTNMHSKSETLSEVKKDLESFVKSDPSQFDGMVIPETFSSNFVLESTNQKFKQTFDDVDDKLSSVEEPPRKLVISTALVTGQDNKIFQDTNREMIESRANMNEEQKQKNLDARGSFIGILDEPNYRDPNCLKEFEQWYESKKKVDGAVQDVQDVQDVQEVQEVQELFSKLFQPIEPSQARQDEPKQEQLRQEFKKFYSKKTMQSDFVGDPHKEYKENTSPPFISSYNLGMAGSQCFMEATLDLAKGNQVFILNDLRRYDNTSFKEIVPGSTAKNMYIGSERVHKIWSNLSIEDKQKIDFKKFADETRRIFFGDLNSSTDDLLKRYSPQPTSADSQASSQQEEQAPSTFTIMMKHYKDEMIKENIAEIFYLNNSNLDMSIKKTVLKKIVDEVFEKIQNCTNFQDIQLALKGNEFLTYLSKYPHLGNSIIPRDKDVFNYARKQLESYRVRVDKNSHTAAFCPFYARLFQHLKHLTLKENKITKSIFGQTVEQLEFANQPVLLALFKVLNETNPNNFYSCIKALEKTQKILEKKMGSSRTAMSSEKGKTIKLLELTEKYFTKKIESLQKKLAQDAEPSPSDTRLNLSNQDNHVESNLDVLIGQNSSSKRLKRIFDVYKHSIQDKTQKSEFLSSWLETFEIENTPEDIIIFYEKLNFMGQREINQFYTNNPINVALNRILVSLDDEKYELIIDTFCDYLTADTILDKNRLLRKLLLDIMKPREFNGKLKSSFDKTSTINKLRKELGQSNLIEELMDKSLDYPMLKMIHEVGSMELQGLYDQMSTDPSKHLKLFVEKLSVIGKDEEFFNQLSDQQKIIYHQQMGSHFVDALVKESVDDTVIAKVCQTSTISPAMRFEVLQKTFNHDELKDKFKHAHESDLAEEFKEFDEFKKFKESVSSEKSFVDIKNWIIEKSTETEFSVKNLAKAMSYLPDDDMNRHAKNILANISLYQLYYDAKQETKDLDEACNRSHAVQSIQIMSNLRLVTKSTSQPLVSVASAAPVEHTPTISGTTMNQQIITPILKPVALPTPITVQKGEDGIPITIEQPPKTSNIKLSCDAKDLSSSDSFNEKQVDVMVTIVQNLLLNWKKGKIVQFNVETEAQACAMYFTCMLLSEKLKEWDKHRYGAFSMDLVVIHCKGKNLNLTETKKQVLDHNKPIFAKKNANLTKIDEEFKNSYQSDMKAVYESMLTHEEEKIIQQFDDEVKKKIYTMKTKPGRISEALYKSSFFEFKQKNPELSTKTLDILEKNMKKMIKMSKGG
jgi:hypothetical protein